MIFVYPGSAKLHQTPWMILCPVINATLPSLIEKHAPVIGKTMFVRSLMMRSVQPNIYAGNMNAFGEEQGFLQTESCLPRLVTVLIM